MRIPCIAEISSKTFCLPQEHSGNLRFSSSAIRCKFSSTSNTTPLILRSLTSLIWLSTKKPSTLFFAGRFDEALRTLIPAIKERPGVVPYVIATIYLRMERHAEGIPYALQACIDTPEDIQYR